MHRSIEIKQLVSRAIMVAIGALFVEIVLFNLPSITTLTAGGGTLRADEIAYDAEKGIARASFTVPDIDVKSICIPSEKEGTVHLYATDDGNAHLYNIGSIELDPSNPRSRYAVVDLAGNAQSIVVEARYGESDAQELSSLEINVSIPFDISSKRISVIALAFSIIALASVRFLYFRPFRVSRWVNLALWMAAALPMLFVLVFVSFPCNAETGTYDSFQHHEYFELAKAIAHGNVALDLPVSPELEAMANPYDTAARSNEGVSFYWDYAYFQGSYYVYFGILPCLMYHLPFYLLTGGELLNEWAVFISILFVIAGSIYLMNVIITRWFPDVSWGSYLVGYVVVLVGSWGLFRIRHANLYSVPIVTGLACVVFALAFWISSTKGERINLPRAAAGTLCASLTLACRPQLFLVSLLGLVLFLDALRKNAGRGSKTLVVFTPLVVILALVGLYNYARFGSPFDFGANYNLTSNDMTQRDFSLVQAVESLYYYLLFPVCAVPSYPYIEPAMPTSWALGALITQGLPGGILAMTPILLMSAALCTKEGLTTDGQDGLLKVISVVSLGIGFTLVVFDGMGAGVLVRYFSDFGFFFALPAAIASMGLFGRIERGCQCASGIRLAVLALLSLSVVLQMTYMLFSPVY